MWKKFRRVTGSPLFAIAIAIYFFVLAWRMDNWVLGFCAGMFTAMAIDEGSDWLFDRWKERYQRGSS